jgi:hypothetical protein
VLAVLQDDAEFYREEKVFAAAEQIGITLDHLENI